jgi:hypothetical protein
MIFIMNKKQGMRQRAPGVDQILKNSIHESAILELIENQVRNDENSLTQSDLQGRVSALVLNIVNDSKGL